MKKKYIGAACILVGIVLAAFPFLKETYADYRQQEILEEWKQGVAAIETDREEIKKETPVPKEYGESEDVVGILKIPSIALEQPVLKGAAEQNLNLSLATIEPTGKPGAEGNIAIAGHNSRTYGRHFNRLAEVSPGDEIILEAGGVRCTYQVTDRFVVEAEDVWVLEDTLEGAEITLVTCYYPENGKTQRLIVKGLKA